MQGVAEPEEAADPQKGAQANGSKLIHGSTKADFRHFTFIIF